MKHLHVLIMAGGRGERFWPQSRQNLPKQFLKLKGRKTLLQETVERLKGLIPPSKIWVLTHESHVTLARKSAPSLNPKNIIGEPLGKDTAPCIAVAAGLIMKKDPNAVMAVLPADHTISPKQKFQQVLKEAARMAQSKQALITLGIPPRNPHTGYGYIQIKKSIRTKGRHRFFQVAAFKEKPNLKTAKQYLKKGGFYWNSGIFVWEAKTILNEIKKYLPNIYKQAMKVQKDWGTKKAKKTLKNAFQKFEKISIDYGVLEKSDSVYMAKAPFNWDDVGSWISLSKYLPKDSKSNTFQGEVLPIQTQNSILVATDGLVATLGVQNLIVVSTPEVTLVADKSKEQEVKRLLSELKKKKSLVPYL